MTNEALITQLEKTPGAAAEWSELLHARGDYHRSVAALQAAAPWFRPASVKLALDARRTLSAARRAALAV